MKSELSSVDVSVLVKELNVFLNDSRVKNIYQIGNKELKIKLSSRERGVNDLIITPKFICLSKYTRPSPETPTSFAMQLRKHLKGSFIKEVRQHKFDRIVELTFSGKESSHTLVVELFSSGNVILCDDEGMILGLLEWQRWKHRRLGAGQEYKHPPEGVNPRLMDKKKLKDIIKKSGKNIVSTLAADLNLGGLVAEELCLRSKINKNRESSSLKDDEMAELFNEIANLIDGKREARLIFNSENNMVDAVPFNFQIYSGFESKRVDSFNDAVDEFFSKKEIDEVKSSAEKKYQQERSKLERIEEDQRNTIGRLREEQKNSKLIGDLIYQNIQDMEELINTVNEARKKKHSWDEINSKLAGRKINKLEIVEVNSDGSIILKETK